MPIGYGFSTFGPASLPSNTNSYTPVVIDDPKCPICNQYIHNCECQETDDDLTETTGMTADERGWIG